MVLVYSQTELFGGGFSEPGEYVLQVTANDDMIRKRVRKAAVSQLVWGFLVHAVMALVAGIQHRY
jgi:hypothetical protein